MLARRRLRAWILRRGAEGAWDRHHVPSALAWVGNRWARAAEALQLAALIHLSARRPAEAVALFDAAIACGLGGWASVRYDLGMALMACGELARAEVEFREACRLTGGAGWALYGLQMCHLQQGRLVEAVDVGIRSTARLRGDEREGGSAFPEFLRVVIPSLPASVVHALRDLVANRPDALQAKRLLAQVEAEQGNLSLSLRLLRECARGHWPTPPYAGSGGTMPHFLIIGQAKAGTSALFTYLRAHPQMVAPLLKEPHFWAHYHRHGLDWYRAFFPPLPRDAGLITGEGSVSSFTDPEVPRRVSMHLPAARLILLLRDPVRRAYSEYWMNVRLGLIDEDFSTVIARELERTPVCPLDDGAIAPGFLTDSAALPHLKRWLRYVPAETLLIVQNRDLATDLPGVMARVCRHLGIAPFVPPVAQRHNEGTYPPMPPELEERLRTWFAEHDRALADFLATLPPATRGIAT